MQSEINLDGNQKVFRDGTLMDLNPNKKKPRVTDNETTAHVLSVPGCICRLCIGRVPLET